MTSLAPAIIATAPSSYAAQAGDQRASLSPGAKWKAVEYACRGASHYKGTTMREWLFSVCMLRTTATHAFLADGRGTRVQARTQVRHWPGIVRGTDEAAARDCILADAYTRYPADEEWECQGISLIEIDPTTKTPLACPAGALP